MTVSRVIGNVQSVRESYRRRVNAAIEELGYQPNAAARTLAGAGTPRIGVMYGNPSASYTSELLVSMLANSVDANCQLILGKCSTSKRRERATAQQLINRQVAGVILQTPLCDPQAFRGCGNSNPCRRHGQGRRRGIIH